MGVVDESDAPKRRETKELNRAWNKSEIVANGLTSFSLFADLSAPQMRVRHTMRGPGLGDDRTAVGQWLRKLLALTLTKSPCLFKCRST